LNEADICGPKYEGYEDGYRIIVNSIGLSGDFADSQVERIIETLTNLRHPCIAGMLGVVSGSPQEEMKIVEKHVCSDALSTVISTSPEWWTPTKKAKAVVSLVLGLRFAHSFGLLHGHLTMDNIFVNEDGLIEITDFCMRCQGHEENDKGWNKNTYYEGFSGYGWTPRSDVSVFRRILREIVIGDVPSFVLEQIDAELASEPQIIESFADIFRDLQSVDFEIMTGVDVTEVRAFASWIEWSERLTE
jgi:serine/threonine protein kinase